MITATVCRIHGHDYTTPGAGFVNDANTAEGSHGGNRAPLLISHTHALGGDTSSGRTPILDEHDDAAW